MNISDLIEEIIDTKSRGKELLMDAFIIGLAFGREILKNNVDLKQAINQFSNLNDQIQNSKITSFYKIEKFNDFINNNAFQQLFNISKLNNNYQLDEFNTPKKPLQSNKQTPQTTMNKSPPLYIVSPQETIQKQQVSNICSLCNFQIDSNQKSKLSLCLHEFHFLCLYIHTQVKGDNCPTCQKNLDKSYISFLQENLPIQYKSFCPNLNCEMRFIYYGQETFECVGCFTKWCLKCKNSLHQGQECIFDDDHFDMKLGQKFKIDQKRAKRYLFINELFKSNYLI